MLTLATALVVPLLVTGSLYPLFKYKNRSIRPDYYEYCKTRDRVPSGKIGVCITGLVLPGTLGHTFFYNCTKKILNVITPWPFRLFAQADKGIVLPDPVRHHVVEAFCLSLDAVLSNGKGQYRVRAPLGLDTP